MKKPTFCKAVFTVFILLLSFTSVAQTYKTFSIRKKIDVRGGMTVAGNNILSYDKVLPYNDNTKSNQDISMQYVDIDGDATTFNSSSADVIIPKQKNGTPSTCYRVAYAALYWSAMLQSGSRTDIHKVKLKLPGATTYENIVGTVVYDAGTTPIDPDSNKPYACYADVTSYLNKLPTMAGTYTVADVVSSTGTNGSTGLSAGWTLFVVYEDPSLNMKSFNVFDGFSHVYSSHYEKIPVSGFITPPSGNIDLEFAYAALDGDKPQGGTKLEFDTKEVTTPLRSANNFFGSVIENTNGVSTPRNPAGSNTLGYDTGMLQVKSAQPEYIDHDATNTSFTLQVARGQADPVFVFFNAYAVDVIAPDIELTKIVKNAVGTDIGGQEVLLADRLFYEISYQNVGNDNVTGTVTPDNPTGQYMIIKDVLPKNVIFNYPTDLTAIDLTNSGGATVLSYNAATRTIIFQVPNSSVQIGDPIFTIRLKVQVVPDCNLLSDACSNEIKNQAFASYQGAINKTPVIEEGSFASTVCNFGTGAPTNFLVGITDCKFTKKFILCNTSVVLTASSGYSSYVWSKTLNGPSIGTGQTFTATQTGVYYVHATAAATCKSIDEEITVVPFGSTISNPVIPYAQAPYGGSVTTCTINGKLLPNIFLCGANDVRAIKTGINDATSIIWEKLNENGTCPAATSTTICANEKTTCSWSQVGTGPDYDVKTAGQFRLTINYTGGCFSVFYFNAFQNLLNPKVTPRDITCDTKGQITVNNIPASGYEFSLDNGGTGTYQASNIFADVAAGYHDVYIRQIGVTNACLFKVLNVYIRERIYSVTVNVTQPLCYGGKGSVTLQANNVLPQYNYSIYQGATPVNEVGPINASDYSYSALNAGKYTVRVWTADGCDYSEEIEIINPPKFTVTAVLTTPLTCTNGMITVNTFNGTGPFKYFVNGSTSSQSSNQIVVSTPLPTGGKYDIVVTDSKGCSASTSIPVAKLATPVYTVKSTNVVCYGDTTGTIEFLLTSNAGNYKIYYSIDGGANYSTNPLFTGLVANTPYTPKVRYTLNDVDYCADANMPTITLTGPAAALTASAGVGELAGCGPLQGGQPTGLIRFANAQGGTAPYKYSFDGGSTWQTDPFKYVVSSTVSYDLRVKDNVGCEYKIPYNVILDPKPADPAIDDDIKPVYNCDGTATATIVVNTPVSTGSTYTYEYYLKTGTAAPVANTPITSNVFTNVPNGSHTVIVKYNIQTVSSYSNLLSENFGYGDDTTSPGINTSFYCFERQVAATQCKGSTAINDGDYSVTSFIVNPFGPWIQPGDHTPQTVPPTPKGRSLVVNIGDQIATQDVLYQKVINDIIPNQPINFEFYAMNLLNKTNGQFDPDLRVALVDATGTEISWFATGSVPKSEKWEVYPKTAITLNPGPYTTLKFIVRSNVRQTSGNDVAIDDIKVYQMPKSCGNEKSIPVVIDSNNAFKATTPSVQNTKCSTSADGSITISAVNFDPALGFYYSTNNGSSFTNSKTSPVTVSYLGVGTYKVIVKNDVAGTCKFSFDSKIDAPQAVVIVKLDQTAPTCITGGSITVTTVSGGTGAYQYQLSNASGVYKAYQTSNTFTNIPQGTYTVMVKDANSCLSPASAPITLTTPTGPTASITPTAGLCFDGSNASITVGISGGTSPYSYKVKVGSGTYGALSATFTGTSFVYPVTAIGDYSFIVVDKNSCESVAVTQTINDKLTVATPVTTSLDCDVAPANQAVITGTISGGTAPFVVSLISGTGGTLVQPVGNGNTFTYSNAVAGTYKFKIVDANNCSINSSDAKIDALVVVTGKSTVTNETCGTPDNGSVTLEALTGVAPFTYSFNNSGFTGTVTYGSLAGSVAGTSYPYKIKDSKGCIYSGTATVLEPTPIAISASITTAYTCDNLATITATASNGNGGYTFDLIRGTTIVSSNSTGLFPNLSVAGSYTVKVTDSKNCSVTSTPAMVITALNKPASWTIGNSALTCPTNKATVTITNVKNSGGVVIATSGLQFRIVLPTATVFQASSSFANLDPGVEYTFEVKDANNCRFSDIYTITPLPVFTVILKSSVNEACLNAADGSAIFTVSGLGNGIGYTYKVDTRTAVSGTSPATGTSFDIPVAGLSAGAHTIIVTNTTTTCPVSAPVTITAPSAVLKLNAPTLTHVTCLAKGTATINAVGGWGTNTYTVTPKSPAGTAIVQVNNNKFIDLGAGTYSVSVKDLSGCSLAGADFTINDKVLPAASISATSTYCAGGAGATLIVTPTVSPQANYRYSINGGTPQVSGTFSGLVPGDYTIEVSDITTGCTLPLAKQTIALPMTASTSLLADLDCDVAPASPDASIEVTIDNGYPDYKYRVNKTGVPFSGTYTNVGAGLSVFTYPAATAGTYYFEITDSKSCTTVVSRTINALVKPDFTFSQVDVKCKSGATGSITVTGVPASGTYTYILTPTAPVGSVVSQTTNVFNNLKAGTYDVQVKDEKKCTSLSKTVTITEPVNGLTATANLTTKLTCDTNNASQAATITVTAINGTPFSGTDPYRYSYNGVLPAVTSNTFTTSVPGAVSIVVYDANNCPYTVPVSPVVNTLNPPKTMTFAQANPITCDPTKGDTDLTVSFLNGVGPFKVEITSTDAGVAPTNPVVTGVTTNSHTFANLASGTYYFKVTDANNCTLIGNYTINPVVTIQASGSIFTDVTCNGAANGVLKFTVSGNRTGGYTYTLVGSISGTIAGGVKALDVITYSNLKGGENYTFTVTNTATKCQDTDAVTLSQPTAITGLTANATKVFCSNLSTTITVTASGGTSPLYYAVVKLGAAIPVFPTDYNTTGIFTKDTGVYGLAYDVYVVDKNGNCPQKLTPVNVVKDPAPTVTASAVGQCLGVGTYTITATPGATVFGTPMYSLNGGSFVSTNTFTVTAADDYTITIKDGNGCTAPSNIVTVAPKLTVSGTLDKDITCAFTAPFTSNSAQITLSGDGGKGVYTYEYSLNGGTFTSFAGPVYKTATPGSYIFKIKDASGCSASTSGAFVVTAKVDPVIDDVAIAGPVGVTVTQKINCTGDASAAIAIAMDDTKGLEPFVFRVERLAPTYQDYGTQTSGLKAGDYKITATDAKGCYDTELINIAEPTPIILNYKADPITCNSTGGVSLGKITILSVSGGTPNYIYHVTGVNGYDKKFPNQTGSAMVFDVVDFGLYQIIITDANGCSKIQQDILVASPPNDLDINIVPLADCTTLGSATVSIGNLPLGSITGTGPFYFRIYTGPGVVFNAADPSWKPESPAGSKKATFGNLIPGVSYTFMVYDADAAHGGTGTGCYYYETSTAPIPTSSTISVNPLKANNITCTGSANGNVSFTINQSYGAATPVKYQIYNSLTVAPIGGLVSATIPASGSLVVNNFGNLPTGNYFVLVTEDVGATNAGCSKVSAYFNITESAILLSVSASVTKKSNTCVANAGIITAIAKDGTGPYLYQIFTDAGTAGIIDATDNITTNPTFSATFTAAMTANTFKRSQGNYIVYAKDAYGCIKAAFVSLVDDVAPTINALPTTAVCPADMPKTITISGTVFTGSSITYAVGSGLPAVAVPGAYQILPNFKLTASGNYTFFVKDDNGCVAKAPYTINDEIIVNLKVDKQLDCTASPNAIIHADIEGGLGTGKYFYKVKIGSGAFGSNVPITGSSFDYPAVTSDTYTFVITDNVCSFTQPISVGAKVPTVFGTSVVNVKCFGDNTGSITVNVTSGEGPFEYKLTGGPVSYPYQDSNQFNLLKGSTAYIVTVRSKANLCEYTKPITVGQPNLALAISSPTIIKLSCGVGNSPQPAKVTLNVTAGTGTGSYQYNFNGKGYDTVNVFTVDDNGSAQIIPYSIKDANGCEVTSSVTIDKLDPPTNFAMTPSAVITCATTAVNVTISNVVNSAGPVTTGLTYQIVSPSSATSNVTGATSGVFTNLAPGNYVFQVTYAATGCVKQLPYEIKDVVKINIVEQSTTGITCSTAADGKASFFVSGFASTATYRYELDGVAVPGNLSSSTINLTGLAKGPHTIKVIDNVTACPKLINFDIDAPAAALAIASKVVTPLGCTTFGAVKITATGGWGNYEYTVKQPNNVLLTNNTGVFGGLTQTGLYSISVKDANGCVVTDSFNLVTPTNPTAAIAATSDFCYDTVNGATLVVNASLGVAPYLFSIDNGNTFSPSNTLPTPNGTYTFKNLAPGSYDVVVKDAYGCESTVPLNRVIEPQLFATAQNLKDIFCTGTVNGAIKIDAVGGYGSYTYTVAKDGAAASAPIAFPAGSNTANYSVVSSAPGSYVFVVYDARGCSYPIANAIVMVAPTPVTYTATPTSPSCIGTQGNIGNGSILVTLAAGNNNPDYTYSIVRTAPTAGSTITQVNNGLFTGLIAGTYSVTVTSERGCSTPKTVVINAPVVVTAAATASAFTCSPANTVNVTTVTVTGTGGAGTGAISDYTYSENGTTWKTTNTFTVIDNGSTQNLTYFVKDANGCMDDVQIPIAKFPRLVSATASLVTKAACNNTGEVIKVDIVGGASPTNFEYQVAINGGAYSTPAIPLAALTFNYTASTAGSYYEFKITDKTTGCSIVSNVYSVPLFNIMEVAASVTSNVSCNGGTDGAIEINVTDYSGAYTYKVFNGTNPVAVTSGSGNTSTNPFVIPFGLAAGTKYRVEVAQSAYPSCTVSSTAVGITQPPVLNLSGLVISNVNQNCNNTGSVLTVDESTIVGGTPGFTYAFVPAGQIPTNTDYKASNTKTFVTTKIAPLFDAYDVYVKDSQGCPAFKTVQIMKDPMPAIAKVSVLSQCASTAGYRIDVTASGVAPLKYSLDGVQFQDNAFFIVDAPGNYTVSVMDKNQCVTTATATTILEPLTLRGEVSLLPTCKDADGEITLFAAGGTVTPANNYEYTKDNWVSKQSSAVFGGLAPGTYNFKVRDLGTLCEKGVQVIITVPTDVTAITSTVTPVSCNGGSDGTVLVAIAATNDNPIYTYALSGIDIMGNPVSRPVQNSPIFENLRASQLLNDYTVTVTSGRGCEGTSRVKVVEPGLIVVNTNAVNVAQFACATGTNEASSATITVNPANISGGSGNYVVYEFFKAGTILPVQKGVNNVYTEVDFAGGSYTVNVYDDNGCMGTSALPIIIDEYIRLDEINVVKTAITCNNLESITVTAVDPSGTAIAGTTYDLVDVSGVLTFPTNTTGIFTGLKVGNYIITATNPATGCSIQKVHYVNEPNTFLLDAVKTSDVVCFGSNEGAVTINLIDKLPNPTNEAGAFSYTVVGPVPSSGNLSNAGPLNLTGLTAGQYTVTATLLSTPYCTVETTFTISQPAAELEISETHTPITCVTGNNDGSISANAVGGWPGAYEFQLELVSGAVITGWGSSSNFTSLIAGDYIVKVRDSKKCIDKVAVTLVNPTPITAVLLADKLTLACFGDTNVILTVEQPVTGGSGFYNYTLESTYSDGTVTLNGPQTSNVFANLGVGSYRVIVSDTWGCSAVTNAVVINEPTVVTASLVKASAQTCLSAATLTLSATGGTGPYTYSADPNFTNVLGTFTSSVTFPVPFTTVDVDHLYYVKDSNGCVSFNSNTIAVTPLEPLDFKYENDNPYINCLGDNNGQITAIAKGGSGNYIYTLFDGSGNVITPAPVQLEPGHFTQLLAGDYLVEVKSGDCTSARKPITITQPTAALIYTPVVTDVTCNGNGDGKLELTASGGTGVIKFALSPDLDKFLDSGTFLNLKVGQYQAIIQDERGCNHVYDFKIEEPLPIVANVDLATVQQALCAGDKASFGITISGGIAPYSTSIDGGAFVPYIVGEPYKDLSGGKHTVIVQDANTCPVSLDVLLDLPVVLNPTADPTETCEDNLPINWVIVKIDVSNNPADVMYSLDGTGAEQASNKFTNLAPGDHFVMVHHTKNNCYEVSNIFPIEKIDPLTLSVDLGGLNEIVFTAKGGTEVYQYMVNGESIGSNNKFIYYRSGEYMVTVIDSHGCMASVTKYFEFIDIKIPPIFTPTGDGTNDNWKPTNTENYPDIKFVVYDRYGRQVGTFGAGQSWDGKYNGTELPMGDYWYVLKLRHSQDDREFIGHFTLYR